MQEFGGASGIVLALVALLWVGVLVPVWVRDHNERLQQRNAIRLQQTIRALAETAERPEVVELEARARVVRAQRRELRRAERASERAEREQARLEAERAERELHEERLRAETWRVAAETRTTQLAEELARAEAEMMEAEARRAAAARAREAARLAAEREALAAGEGRSAQERWANGASGSERAVHRRLTAETPRLPDAMREAAARRRRGRRASTGVALAGLAVLAVGVLVLSGGAATALGAGLVIAGGALVGGAVWMLQRIHLVAQAALAAPAVPVAEEAAAPIAQAAHETAPFVVHDIEPSAAPAPDGARTWTPVPLPKPLYLERATAGELPPTDPTDPDRPARDEDAVDREIADLLREEAERATEALRAAHREAEGADFGRRGQRARRVDAITVGGDWERMGDVAALAGEYGEGDCADLDAVLRRRRAG